MLEFVSKHIMRGVEIAKSNSQILYTLFLMIVIPFAFFASGQKFFDISGQNQNRIEYQSVQLLQDSFNVVVRDHLNDPIYLDRSLRYFKEKNPSISEFFVVAYSSSTPKIIASINQKDVGNPDSDNERIVSDQYGIIKKGTMIIPVTISGDRHVLAYRGIVDDSGNMLGYIVTNISMQWLDDLSAAGMYGAYAYLILIIVFIFILLIRLARIVDYAGLYRRLKEVDQMKDDFVSMASHELRTPLTIIRGYVDLLSEVKSLDDKQRENLRRIDVSAKQLNLLVGDILDVSRLEQGRMSFVLADVDLGAFLREIADNFVTVATEKGLALSCEVPDDLPKVSVDPERLKQVMTNIVGNAVKYTPHGNVVVKAAYDERKGKIIIRVSDTGLGMSAEDQKKLFQKFYRIRNKETENIQGTGLGLWITQKIVTSMKGELGVESIQGKGTDFIVAFPPAEPVKK